MEMPQTVKLSKDESAKLRKLNDKTQAIDSFVKTVVAQGEARIAELQAEGRDIWSTIAATHSLDLQSVNYSLDDDGETLIPTGMKL